MKFNIQETFQNTIQGEGYHSGRPCDFIRLYGCPVGCFFCDTGYASPDGDYYKKYIFVAEGQSVKKGDVIAKLYKPDAQSDSTHIHFHVSSKLSGGFHCPNIFTPSINSDFKNVSGGKPLCYQPAEGEDLTGL